MTITRRHRAVGAAAALGAVLVSTLGGPASAELLRRDSSCEGSGPSPFTTLAPVTDPRGVTVEKRPTLTSATRGTTTPIGRDRPFFRISNALWSGVGDDMSVRRNGWMLSFDGLRTATTLDTGLGDTYVLCPWDVGGKMYAVEEVTSYDEATQETIVHARAVSAPIDVVKGRLDVDPQAWLFSDHYPDATVDRTTTLYAITRKPDINGSPKQTIRWSIGSTTVSTASTYTPRSADWGKTLRGTATYSADGYEDATAIGQGVVKRAPSMANTTTVLGGGKVKVAVKVVVVGTSRPAGPVRILEDNREVALIEALSNGSGSVTLTGRKRGTHVYAADYAGNRLVQPAIRYRTVTVR